MWQKSISVEMGYIYSQDTCLDVLCSLCKKLLFFLFRGFPHFSLKLVGCNPVFCVATVHVIFPGPGSPQWRFSILSCLYSSSVTAVQFVHKFRKRKSPLDYHDNLLVHGRSWMAHALHIRWITPLPVFHTHCNSQKIHRIHSCNTRKRSCKESREIS